MQSFGNDIPATQVELIKNVVENILTLQRFFSHNRGSKISTKEIQNNFQMLGFYLEKGILSKKTIDAWVSSNPRFKTENEIGLRYSDLSKDLLDYLSNESTLQEIAAKYFTKTTIIQNAFHFILSAQIFDPTLLQAHVASDRFILLSEAESFLDLQKHAVACLLSGTKSVAALVYDLGYTESTIRHWKKDLKNHPDVITLADMKRDEFAQKGGKVFLKWIDMSEAQKNEILRLKISGEVTSLHDLERRTGVSRRTLARALGQLEA